MLFYLFGSVAVGASLLVIAQPNPIYSVLLLIASFGALSGLYILLDAPFVAVIQIIIYAGAIMVLFLFVVMLLNASRDEPEGIPTARIGPTERHVVPARGAVRFGAWLALALGAQLVWALTTAHESGEFPGGSVSSVNALGRLLFTEYAFAFEVTSILILVAMVGAVVLARREERRQGPGEDRSREVSA
jgi:NADH-quinone oxidoreductase subunit J